ncbi:MAG: hypothetical protein FWC80_05405 [Firmicutes bacterium]|nr:hypothetical protein [Bacillota bacterium]
MDFRSSIRKIEGRLDINFFANGADGSVEIANSTKNNGIDLEYHAHQIFDPNLSISNRLTTFDDGGIKLDGESFLIADRSYVGWIGDRLSLPINDGSGHGRFEPAQAINLSFHDPRRLPHFGLRGVRIRQRDADGELKYEDGQPDYDNEEYPVDFVLTVFVSNSTDLNIAELRTLLEQRSITNNMPNKQWQVHMPTGEEKYIRAVCQVTGNSNLDFVWDELPFDRDVEGVKLEISRWSKANVLPRITYFSGEMHQSFNGNTLQSIEVLEEKTGVIDTLSYGLSSNYCKVSFVNKDRMFYDPQHFRNLRRNRSVLPRIRCGDGELKLLGRFFSDEWHLDDRSAFMSCRAYDVLYSLQDVIINFGMEFPSNRDLGIVRPFRSTTDAPWTIEKLIERVFRLINDKRMSGGLFEQIRVRLNMPTAGRMVLPVVLIEEKSAWAILQDIAKLCCAYVYVDRDGWVVFEEDEWISSNAVTGVQIPALNAGWVYTRVPASGERTSSNSASSIVQNGLREYTHDASMLVMPSVANTQNPPLAVTGMADNILAKYEEVAFVDAEWTGDPAVGLGSKFDAHSRHEREDDAQTYECLSNEFRLNGRGFRQTTKGRSLPRQSPSVQPTIHPNNAFRYSLPVTSRMIVNQVNYRYSVLEGVTDPQEIGRVITVRIRDCIVRGNTIEANVPLNRVWERIVGVRVYMDGKNSDEIRILPTSTANILRIEFTADNIESNTRFDVRINP